MPLGSDASTNIEELTKVHGGEKAWPRDRIIAAGMHAADENAQDRTTTYERKRRKQKQESQARGLARL